MEWIRGPILGRGSTAMVSLAASTTTTHELFAVKSVELSRSNLLQKEQFLMSQLRNHPSIVTYMGYDVTRENDTFFYNLWMEYVPGGTLQEAIKRHGGKLDESVIKSYTRRILQGLDHLHANGIVHCDIKSQNILLGNDGPKIADLGCAKKLMKIESGDVNSSCCAPNEERLSGTPMFMSPEVARGEEQGFAADVWAVGCMVLEMASGSTPWPEAEDPVSVLYRIGFSGDVPVLPGWLSEDAKDFLRNCLRRDPKERWLVKELLRHPFVNEMEVKEIGFHMNSPSDVLDSAFWESMDVCESPRNLNSSDCSCSCSTSVDGRIEQLIGSNSMPNMPNWACDEDWVTIRDNREDGSTENFWQNEEIVVDNDSHVDDQSVVSSIVMYSEEFENPIFDVFNEISFDYVNAPGYVRREHILSADLDGVKDDIAMKSLNLEEENKEICFPKSILLLLLFYLNSFSLCL